MIILTPLPFFITLHPFSPPYNLPLLPLPPIYTSPSSYPSLPPGKSDFFYLYIINMVRGPETTSHADTSVRENEENEEEEAVAVVVVTVQLK